MPRADLRGLIGSLELETQLEQPARGPGPRSKTRTDIVRVMRQDPPAAESAEGPDETNQEPAAAARFSDFERKETRLRLDQQNALTVYARQLNRRRGPGTPRITDNTLIRVAIDLLLARADKLAGRDEGELRRSVGLKERGQP